MTCQLCNQPGEYRDRFKAVLCPMHNLEALLGFLNGQPKVMPMGVYLDESQDVYRSSWDIYVDRYRFSPRIYEMEAYQDETQGGSPNPLDHPRLRA